MDWVGRKTDFSANHNFLRFIQSPVLFFIRKMANAVEFSLRIVSVDSYQSRPQPGLDSMVSNIFPKTPAQKVPVIRVFGSTPAGQTVCMHIHRIFPYIYVPYDGSKPVDGYLRQFALSLDHALNTNKKAPEPTDKPTTSTQSWNSGPQQHVFQISIVKGIPFYGFYEHEVLFLKIYFYNSQSVRLAMRLLVDGAVLRKSFQPYEAHIPYISQFFMDYNLQGMNYINVTAVQFRKNDEKAEPSDRIKFREASSVSSSIPASSANVSTTYHSPSLKIFPTQSATEVFNKIPRTTTCELEVDVTCDDIMNREEIEVRAGTNPGLAAIWRDENQRRQQRGLAAVFSLPASQEREEFPPANSQLRHMERLKAKLAARASLATTAGTSTDQISDMTVQLDDSLLCGVNAEGDVDSSFVLDRHNGNRTDFHRFDLEVLKTATDDEDEDDHIENKPLPEPSASQDDLAKILADLAEMADRDDLDMETSENLWDLLQQDDAETAEMANCVPLSPDPDDVPPPESVHSPPKPPKLPLPNFNDFGREIVDPDSSPEEPRESPQFPAVLHPEIENPCPTESNKSFLDLFPPETPPTERIPSPEADFGDLATSGAERDFIPTSPVFFETDDERDFSGLDQAGNAGNESSKWNFSKFGEDFEEGDECVLTPMVPFPGRDEIESTGGLHGLYGHDNSAAVYSSVRELIQGDLLGDADVTVRRTLASLPIEKLAEFDSRCIPVKSSDLFKSARRFVRGEIPGAKRAINGLLRPPVKRKRDEPDDPVASRVAFMAKICNEPPIDPDRQWTVTLTPAIPFPNLSHVERLQARIASKMAELDGVPRDEVVFGRKEVDVEERVGSQFGRDGKGGKRLLERDLKNSGVKARRNKQFESLVGRDLGAIGQALDLSGDLKKKNCGGILHESENLLIISMELHADTRGSQAPDPQRHPIRFLAYTLMTDTGEGPADGCTYCLCVVADYSGRDGSNQYDREARRFSAWISARHPFKTLSVQYVPTEAALLELFVSNVRSLDPDILAGYEIQLLSWGYLIERGTRLGMAMLRLLSRLLKPTVHPFKKKTPTAVSAWEARKMSEIHVIGRIVLNLWRLMRREVTLNIYSFENVVFSVLKQRICLYSSETLTKWLHLPAGSGDRWRAFEYFILRSVLNTALLTKLDIIRQTSEFSRLFGIQFYDTLTRGSQFRVESMMLRLAKPFCLVPVSPTGQQLIGMLAPEMVPLILEPESRFYQDPVVVLDFQSLYPSMIIAYNYCFSTCLGRVDLLGSDNYFKFGCTALQVPSTWLRENLRDINISPNGVAFVQATVRRGVLSQMLEEILNTRIMVKKAMAEYRDDPVLKKLLNARQLGLKMIANVTFGYTAASFSGRMPCVDISDSILAKARETLELAIKHVENNPRWQARVVYGDTDSMFVLLRGRSKEEAFRIGREMEAAITEMNPKPVKLKFEKVYKPCILQTKKRYCGNMYETEDQIEPIFDAKGIETVRRDTCPLVSKALRMLIEQLFSEKCDILSVKLAIQKTFTDVLTGDVPMQDFIFAKEYRGRESYKPGAKVPALEIAKKASLSDFHNEPRIGERVPYIIVYGPPRETLIALIRQPWEIFTDASLRPHGFYYCTRQLIPVLNRILLLIGLDSQKWFTPIRDQLVMRGPLNPALSLCSDLTYFRRFCGEVVGMNRDTVVVSDTRRQSKMMGKRPPAAYFTQWAEFDRQTNEITKICQGCMGTKGPVMDCVSFDCPILYRLFQSANRFSRFQCLPNLTLTKATIPRSGTR